MLPLFGCRKTPPRKLSPLTPLDPHIYDVSEASNLSTDLDTPSPSPRGDARPGDLLTPEDLGLAKKLLTRVCNQLVESSCHHGPRARSLAADTERLQTAASESVRVLDDLILDAERKVAENLQPVVMALDPGMSTAEELALLGRDLDKLEAMLEHSLEDMERETATVQLLNDNLSRQTRLETYVDELVVGPVRLKAVVEALDLENDRLLRHAFIKGAKSNLYGVAELSQLLPLSLVGLTEFQRDLFNSRRFLEPSCGSHVDFDRLDALLDRVKEAVSTQMASTVPDALSPAESLADTSEVTASPSGQSDSFFINSTHKLEHAVGSESSSASSRRTTASDTTQNSVEDERLQTAVSVDDLVSAVSTISSTIAI